MCFHYVLIFPDSGETRSHNSPLDGQITWALGILTVLRVLR